MIPGGADAGYLAPAYEVLQSALRQRTQSLGSDRGFTQVPGGAMYRNTSVL